MASGQYERLNVLKATPRTPAQDERLIAPAVIKHVYIQGAELIAADVPGDN
jgi:hypothetical protein